MLGLLKSIFGSSDVVKGGIDAIDEAFYTDEEKAESSQELIALKGKIKIETLNAYAPFKLTQRLLALMFSCAFLIVFFYALVLLHLGKSIQPVFSLADSFNLGYIMLTIVAFYFGGGFVEGITRKIAKRKEQ